MCAKDHWGIIRHEWVMGSGWGLIGRGVKFIVGSWRRGGLAATSGEHWIFGI